MMVVYSSDVFAHDVFSLYVGIILSRNHMDV